MKKLLRRTVRAFGALVVIVVAYLLLLAHPEPLFARAVTYGNFRFFSQTALPPETAEIAVAVGQRLNASELNHPPVHQRVFVVERPWLWTLLNGPYRGVMARNIEVGNAIVIPTLDVRTRTIRHFDGRAAGVVGILAHETVHTLVQRRIGLFRLWRLAWWQKEGYPEYIASDKCAHSEAPARYRSAACAWRYLLETRGLSFDQVIRMQTPNGMAPDFSSQGSAAGQAPGCCG
jgi:hypothetical protein